MQDENLMRGSDSSDTGAPPGPSGWGSNYLSVLADDPHCVQAMAFFVQQIVNNKLPDTVRTLLTASFHGRRTAAVLATRLGSTSATLESMADRLTESTLRLDSTRFITYCYIK